MVSSDAHEKLQQEFRELQIQYFQMKEQYDDLQEKLKFFTKVSTSSAHRAVSYVGVPGCRPHEQRHPSRMSQFIFCTHKKKIGHWVCCTG